MGRLDKADYKVCGTIDFFANRLVIKRIGYKRGVKIESGLSILWLYSYFCIKVVHWEWEDGKN